MKHQQARPDRLNIQFKEENRNVSSLSDSSDQRGALSTTAASSAVLRRRPSPPSVFSSKTNSVAEVTAEESSANRSNENGSSDSSYHTRGAKRSNDYKDDSSSPLIHVHKRRKKVNIESSSSEEKDESAEASSASSNTSDNDDSSSSSSLLYKRGTANSNIKTFVSLRNKQNRIKSSYDTRKHSHAFGDQNDSASSSSSHDATLSKLSSASSHSSPTSDSSDQAAAEQSKDNADDTVKTYVDSSASVSASSDTSDPEIADNVSTSSSMKRKKMIVGSAMQAYQTTSSSSAAMAFDTCSVSSTSTSSSTKRKKVMIGNALETYQSSLLTPTMNKNEVIKEGKASGGLGDVTETSMGTFLSSSTPSSSCSFAVPLDKGIQDETSTSTNIVNASKMSRVEKASGAVRDATETHMGSFLSSSTPCSPSSLIAPVEKRIHDERSTFTSRKYDSEMSRVEKASSAISDMIEANAGSFLSSSMPLYLSSSTLPLEKRKQDEVSTSSTLVRTSDEACDSTVNHAPVVQSSLPPFNSSSNNFNVESLTSKIESCMYRDYSHITPDEIAMTEMGKKDCPRGFLKKELSFPQKLHQILSNPDVQECITWLPHGRAWKILNKAKFEDIVLPSHFHHRKFTSFTRQVNIWGFKRVPSGPDEKAYYHEFFLRGLPHISLKMRRRPSGKLQERMQSVYAQMHLTADFYKMSEDHPLPDT